MCSLCYVFVHVCVCVCACVHVCLMSVCVCMCVCLIVCPCVHTVVWLEKLSMLLSLSAVSVRCVWSKQSSPSLNHVSCCCFVSCRYISTTSTQPSYAGYTTASWSHWSRAWSQCQHNTSTLSSAHASQQLIITTYICMFTKIFFMQCILLSNKLLII